MTTTRNVLQISRSLALPIDAATTTGAICGIRGSGKTNTAVVLVEELLDVGQQCAIFDPTDNWWGLKSSKDGKSAGYPVVVLGGKRGDLPLSSDDGAVIADFIVDNPALSIVLALRHFESKAQEQRFVTDCLRRLYFRKGQQHAPTPITLVFDEASRHVPQMVRGEDAACVGAVQQIVRQGRSSGFGVVLIDQRPATVNKDVLAQLETLVMHRITSPQDRKALTAWIEQHDSEGRAPDFLNTLATLKKGDAWIWSPEFLDIFERVHIRERRTYDSSYTPKIGERHVAPKALADVDLDALKAQLTATIEKARDDDPRVLHGRIAELQGELRRVQDLVAGERETSGASAGELAKSYDEGFLTGWRDGLARAARMTDAQFKDAIDDVVRSLHDRRQSIVDAIVETPAEPIRPRTVAVSRADILERAPRAARRTLPPASRMRDTARAKDGGQLGPGERLILSYIAQQLMTREHISVVTGYKKTSRDTYLRRLAAAGYIEADGDRFRILPAGIKVLGPDYEQLPTGRKLLAYWLDRLPEGEAAILNIVVRDRAGVLRDEISRATSYKKTSRDTYIRRLAARQLVRAVGPKVVASDKLFGV